MNFKNIKNIGLVIVFTVQTTAFASSPSVTLEDEITTYIKEASPATEAIIEDVMVLGTEDGGKEGKVFKTVRFTRVAEDVKSIITMKVEYGEKGVGPESEILSVVKLTPKIDMGNQEKANLYESAPATNLFSPKPRKKSG